MFRYRYPKQFRIANKGDLVWFALAALLLALLVWAAFADFEAFLHNWGGSLIILLALLFCLGGAVFNLYQYPDLQAGEEGLQIEFLWRKITLPWQQVEHLRPLVTFHYPRSFSLWFVQARGLTLFHRLYGWFATGDPDPGFLIHSELMNCRQLLAEIERFTHKPDPGS